MPISNAYLASIIESSDDAIVSKTLEGIVTSWNHAAESIFGYTAQEMVGESINKLSPPGRQEEMQSILDRIRKGERVHHYETMRRRKDGTLIAVSLTVSPILDQHGQVAGASKIARDITARLKAESRIRELEQRYEVALLASGTGIWSINPQTGFVTRDVVASRLLGLPDDPLESSREIHVSQIHRDDLPKVLDAWEEAVRSGNTYQVDYRVVTPSNGVRWIRDRGRLQPAAAGAPSNLTGCLIDITEQTRASRELELEHARLQSIVEQLPIGVMVVDLPSRRITLSNPAAERILGQSPLHAQLEDELAKRTGFFPDGRTCELNDWPVMRTASTGEFVIDEEITLGLPDGTSRTILITSGSILGPDGQAVGVLATYADITDRKRTEERYRLLFENSPFPLWVYDITTLEFLAVNPAAIEEYGFTEEEFLGMTIADIRPTEDVPELLQRIDALDKGRATVQWLEQPEHQWRHKRKNGSILHVEIRSHPIRFDGHLARLVMAIDVTARKNLEEQLRQSQKMEAIGQLAGGIAHDFNNLLTVIGGYASLSLMGLPENHPIRPNLSQVVAAGERAAALTHQLLAFGRKQVLQPRVLNINAVIEGMRPLLTRLLREDIQLEIRLDPTVCEVEADPHQLEQVLMNLVINASDAMAEGGLVTIETQDVILDEPYLQSHLGVRPGRHAMLAVSDTGHGMDANTQARIFEPFFTTKAPGKGTGLGLSTAYGIVKQSGGHIAVYSEVRVGSTFKVYLPVATASGRIEEAMPIITSQRGHETVLLVEDDSGVRDFAARVLRDLGYTVHEAANGEQALRIGRVLGETLDLLITDVVMPSIGGRQLSEALAPVCRKMRVLFMSGYTENAIVQHGVLDPGLEFLPKPFNSDRLGERVREVLAKPIRPRSILLLEGDPAVSGFLHDALQQAGYEAALVAGTTPAISLCRRAPVDLLVMDALGPPADAIEEIHHLSHDLPHVRLIVIAGNWDDRLRREARRAGAHECLQKPVALDHFLKTVRDLIG